MLKALQRLEKQNSFQEISIQSDLNTVDALTVIRRKARQTRRSKRRRLIGLIVLVIGAGVVFALAKTVFWNPRTDFTVTPPRKIAATISELTTAPEVKKPAFVPDTHLQKPTALTSHTDSPMRLVKKKVVTGQKHSPTLKPDTPPQPAPKSDRMTPLVRKPEKPIFQKAKARLQRADTGKSKVTLKPAKTVTPFPRSSKAAIPNKLIKQPKRKNLKPQPSQPKTSEAPQKLGLRLQAITWLNNPQKRFAVINNSIIRLDEMVDGFRLTQIEEEQVTVEKDNQKWLLKFNRMDYSNGN